ncbi:MAG: hypothetical protein JXB00_08635 [Bacteroidales bacterium]|nr:hypothetical protein [Bacteroidales bacterium]
MNKYKILFLLVLLVFFLLNLITLDRSPLPWLDEVFYADVSHSLSIDQGYKLTILQHMIQEPVIYYGPVFFKLQQWMIGLFSFTPYVIRFLPFIAGIIIIILLLPAMNNKVSILYVLMFSPIFIQSSHSGRMDLIAVLLTLSATLLAFYRKHTIVNALFIGLLLMLAALTTPRAVFLFPGIFSYVILKWIFGEKEKGSFTTTLLYISLYTLPIIAGVIIWSYSATGSAFGFFETISGVNAGNPHIGFHASFLRKQVDDLITVLFIVHLCYQLITRKKVTLLQWSIVFTYLSFSLFVREAGPYGAMIYPFIILYFADANTGPLTKWGTVAIVAVFLGVFGIKNALLIQEWNLRNPKEINKLMSGYIPESSNVMASCRYYYPLKQNHVNVTIFDQYAAGKKLETLEYYMNQSFDYIVVAYNDTANYFVKELVKSNYSELTHITLDNKGIQIIPKSIMSRLPKQILGGYNGLVYKRK